MLFPVFTGSSVESFLLPFLFCICLVLEFQHHGCNFNLAFHPESTYSVISNCGACMESTERLPDRSVIDGLLDEKKTETRQKVEVWIFEILGSEGPDRVTPSAKASAVHQITRLINRIVQDLLTSAWPHARIDGLVALRELTFMMETDWAKCCAQKITNPILVCFSDEDSHVRYKACEAFYNVAKVIRSGILEDMGAVFHGLCRLYTDVEQQIKEGAQSLDRLVRDIVVEQRHFDYSALIPLIAARIHVLNPSVRQLVLGWIVLLDSMPQDAMGLPDPVAFAMLTALGAIPDPMALLNEMMAAAAPEEDEKTTFWKGPQFAADADSAELERLAKQVKEAAEQARAATVATGTMAGTAEAATRNVAQAFAQPEEEEPRPAPLGTTLSSLLSLAEKLLRNC
eukprot:s2400_g5.t1